MREEHGIDIDTTSCIGSAPSILPIVTAIDSITITVRRFLSKRRKSADQTCLTSCQHRSLMTRHVRAVLRIAQGKLAIGMSMMAAADFLPEISSKLRI